MKIKHIGLSLVAALALTLVGCGKHGSSTAAGPAPAPGKEEQPPDRGPQVGDVVVKSTFQVYVSSDHTGTHAMAGKAVTIPISVINAPNVSMTVNSSGLVLPPITNAPLSFGELSLSGLTDNNLRVCGNNGKTKCTTAVIRIYTTGTPKSGMWNADGYGMPITASLGNGKTVDVGLDQAGAAVVQTVTIPSGKNVFRLSDFNVTPLYKIFSDFTEAGAGTYSTTLVVEYGLSL
jgi:hypothetical protein